MAKTNPNTTALVPVETPSLTAINGHGWATSQQVAEHFGKRHGDVLRAIKALGCSEEFGRRNFASSEYLNEQGKAQPMVKMTRDGFSILAMGFTGPQAMAWKEAFIAAFNQLEQAYIEQIEQKAQATIEARDNQLFFKTAKWSEELQHRKEGEDLIRKIKTDPDPHMRRHHFNALCSLYRRLGDEPPEFLSMQPTAPLLGNGPSREELLEQVEDLARVRDMLLSALRGLTAAAMPHLLPEATEDMPEVLRAAAQAIKVANHQKGGAA